jgi:arsenate reductase
MADVTLFHNPNCSTSRHALDEIGAAGVDADVVQYIKTPLSADELLDLMDKLIDPPEDLVRKDSFFKEQGLVEGDYTDPKAVAELLDQYPRLMQRPIIVKGDQAIIGRPKDRVAEFLKN